MGSRASFSKLVAGPDAKSFYQICVMNDTYQTPLQKGTYNKPE